MNKQKNPENKQVPRPRPRINFLKKKKDNDSRTISVRYEFTSSAFFIGGSLLIWIVVFFFLIISITAFYIKSSFSLNF